MQKTCARCACRFPIAKADLEFYARVSPVIGAKRCEIPAPALCPACREQRRMCWRNERSLYARSCDKTGRALVSCYPPKTPFPVFDSAIWWREESPLYLGRDVDFSRHIFDQLYELGRTAPRSHTFNYADDRLENSRYTNCSGDLKNCYLVFGTGQSERCCYSTYLQDCFLCLDCYFAFKCRSCYECVDVLNCDSVLFAQSSSDCHDSMLLYDCRGSADCLACAGLRRKRHHILNKPVSREDYLRKRAELRADPAAFAALRADFEQLKRATPRRCCSGDLNENVVGDSISNSRNCWYCFDTNQAEDCRYCTWFINGKDCMDYTAWGEAELSYQVVAGGDSTYRALFTAQSFGCTDCTYVDLCVYCKNCFACVGLKNEQYCILNKRYTEQEYHRQLPKVIELMVQTGEWGEFFPPALSPHGYNETIAQEHYPLTRDRAEKEGFRWNDYEPAPPKVSRTIPGSELPHSVEELPKDILSAAVICEATGKPFRLTAEELEFYRIQALPPPRRHPEQRHSDRRNLRNPRKIWKRRCAQCEAAVYTSYSPKRPERVLCEECYLRVVV